MPGLTDKAGWTAMENRRGARMGFGVFIAALFVAVLGAKLGTGLAVVGIVIAMAAFLFSTVCLMAARALDRNTQRRM